MMKVRLLIGANAYACVTLDNGHRVDIRLDAGKSAHASLREYAEKMRIEADRKIEMAEIAECAATVLESK